MKYTVKTENPLGQVLRYTIANTEKDAKEMATEWAKDSNNVYITFYRKSDGQHGYLNPDGYGISGKAWN